MLGGQVVGTRGETAAVRVDARSANGLAQILLETAFDHDFLAYVAERVGNCAGGHVASEDMTHVLAGGAISCHVSKIPTKIFVTYFIA